jgi:hypothetical protein
VRSRAFHTHAVAVAWQVGLTRLLCECPRAWAFACWPAAMDAVCKSVRDSRVTPRPHTDSPHAAGLGLVMGLNDAGQIIHLSI